MIESLFKDFEAGSKQEWIANLEKELKGKSFDELIWQVHDKVQVEPFYVKEELQAINHEILAESNPDWQVGEDFEVIDAKTCNKEVLNALMNGTTAPVFRMKNAPNNAEFNTLLHEVGVQYIDTHFAFDYDETNFAERYNQWASLLDLRGLKAEQIPVYFDFDPVEFQDSSVEKSFAHFLKNHTLHNTKFIHVDAFRFHTNEYNVVNELQNVFAKIQQYFELLKANEVSLEQAAHQMHFTFGIGKAYFIEIAKLRAFKLLWAELLKQHQIEPFLPFVSVRYAHAAYGSDKHDNLINATTLAMSAVLGGCNHLVVRPGGETSGDKRHARNVQLILKHESGLDKVADPAGGSYYIEKITRMLVEAAS
jgi:methylmalonyl-CoA mutase